MAIAHERLGAVSNLERINKEGIAALVYSSYGQKIGLYFLKNTIYFLIHRAILWYNCVRIIIAQGLI